MLSTFATWTMLVNGSHTLHPCQRFNQQSNNIEYVKETREEQECEGAEIMVLQKWKHSASFKPDPVLLFRPNSQSY
ncbi:hypothetical protein YC2023_052226 [Brassica napus]